MEYINQNRPEEWRQPAIERALSIWVEEYKELEPETIYGDPMDVDAPQCLDSPASDKPKNLLAQYLEKNRVPRKAMNHGDDLLLFMEDDTIDIGDLKPLQWWCLPEQRQRYPKLSCMAIDIFSVRPSSASQNARFRVLVGHSHGTDFD
jgi:hypothetical protein